jgi:hypothetical protein
VPVTSFGAFHLLAQSPALATIGLIAKHHPNTWTAMNVDSHARRVIVIPPHVFGETKAVIEFE